MASYYRKFILRFSKIAGSLYELTRPKQSWRWISREESAFEELKQALSQSPILAQPNVSDAVTGERPFLVFADASTYGLRAVLCQKGEDSLVHPIYFASKDLPTKAERNYHITDLDALAVVFVLKKFRFFVYGSRTFVYTDHKPLSSLFKQSNVSP